MVHLFIKKHVKVKQNARTQVETLALLNRFVLPQWGDRKLREIRRRDVFDLMDHIIDAGAPTSANRVLSILKTLYRWALNREYVESSPVAGLEKPTEEKSRDRTLTDSELLAVWRAAEQIDWPYGAIILLLTCTGCRRDEVGGMRWSEIDLERKVWIIPGDRRKAGIAHEIPLSNMAMKVLKLLPRFASSDYVFPARPRKAGGQGRGYFSGWSKGKARLDALSGVKGATVHDIRRTVATKLQTLKIPTAVVEEVLGHVTGSRAGIVRVYQRYKFESEKKAALDKWARYLQGLLNPPEPSNVVPLSR
jgi:integrase